MSGFPHQEEIDVYYEKKKKEVRDWLIQYEGEQKRLTKEQRRCLLKYAEQISFSTAGEVNSYVQGLKTVGKKNKQKIADYIQRIEWFPEGVSVGVLDGKIVSRVLPNELDLLYGFQKLNGENNGTT